MKDSRSVGYLYISVEIEVNSSNTLDYFNTIYSTKFVPECIFRVQHCTETWRVALDIRKKYFYGYVHFEYCLSVWQ